MMMLDCRVIHIHMYMKFILQFHFTATASINKIDFGRIYIHIQPIHTHTHTHIGVIVHCNWRHFHFTRSTIVTSSNGLTKIDLHCICIHTYPEWNSNVPRISCNLENINRTAFVYECQWMHFILYNSCVSTTFMRYTWVRVIVIHSY